MANAYRDENSVTTLIASSSADGSTPVRLWADPVTHRLLVTGAAIGIGNPVVGGTAGSVLFVDASGNLGQDNPNFTYSSALLSAPNLALQAGAVGAPALYLGADTTTGIYRSATNTWSLTFAGTQRYVLAAGSFQSNSTGGFLLARAAGTATNPTYSFNGDSNTGMYSDTADVLQFSAGGVLGMSLDASGNMTHVGRILAAATSVASANNITLGNANVFDVTGTTTINTIAGTGWTNGSMITLRFSTSLTVSNNTAGTGAVILLAGGTNFSATANDTLTLMYNSATPSWQEIARAAI